MHIGFFFSSTVLKSKKTLTGGPGLPTPGGPGRPGFPGSPANPSGPTIPGVPWKTSSTRVCLTELNVCDRQVDGRKLSDLMHADLLSLGADYADGPCSTLGNCDRGREGSYSISMGP